MGRRPGPGEPAKAPTVADLRRLAGAEVQVRLEDGSRWTGRLRTDLLTERSLSVYLIGADKEGTTLYIDQIAEIVPAHASADD